MIRRRISKANTKWCFHLDQCQISPKYSQLTHDHRSVWEREPLVIKWASMSVLVCPHMRLSCPRLSLSVPRCPCPVSVCFHLSLSCLCLSPSVPVRPCLCPSAPFLFPGLRQMSCRVWVELPEGAASPTDCDKNIFSLIYTLWSCDHHILMSKQH